MLVVECSGSPFEIGLQHGISAKLQIGRCITFYKSLFETSSGLDWSQVCEIAHRFERKLEISWPDYHLEMRGIAQGSGHTTLDIVALNVRTEIAFGRFSDGCTSLAWHTEKRSYLGQNWDWMQDQKENLIIVKIIQPAKPTIQMITEAGIIGKIGLNSSGVGTCFNAIKAKGCDEARLPVHLGLRLALESWTALEAVEKLEDLGLAAAAHLLIADSKDAIGLEVSSSTTARCVPDAKRRVIHTNHLLKEHRAIVDTVWLKDSIFRLERMRCLCEPYKSPGWAEVSHLFEDEMNLPSAICRASLGDSTSATLFNIVMDLKERTAVIRLGRPVQVEETIKLTFL